MYAVNPASASLFGLLVGEHAEGDARFHAELADRADHVEHLIELRAILDFAPRRPHAKAGGAQRSSPASALSRTSSSDISGVALDAVL